MTPARGARGRRMLAASVAMLVLGLVVAGCGAARVTAGPPRQHPPQACHGYARWCRALSQPRVDSYYPGPSRAGTDALHYLLDLRWDPRSGQLSGVETVVVRAVGDSSALRLALGSGMQVTAAQVDSRAVGVEHRGDRLLLHHAVRAGSVHRVRISYHGRPARALPLQDQRNADGMFRTASNDVFANDEPIGAFRWYAVNDDPSDKAFYDFRLSVPAPRVGIANGRLVSRRDVGPWVVTRFHLDAPAAAYLVTVEFGPYRMTRLAPLHGVPLTVWTPVGDDSALASARYLWLALRYVEGVLGRYPFRSLGLVVVPGYDSGIENQTLITVGDNPYDLSPGTLVHEVVHQWYGDLVTPRDWRDVWMNEGMSTYLQLVWQARAFSYPLHRSIEDIYPAERAARNAYGPPGAYHPVPFAALNVYYGPAVMWDQLRRAVGAPAFWAMVRAWPSVDARGNAGRDEYLAWIQRRLHRDLGPFFRAWLLGASTPPIH